MISSHQPVDEALAQVVEDAPGLETLLTLDPLEATLISPWARDYIWSQPVGWVPARSKRRPTLALKRVVDVIGALALLVLSSPMLAAIAIGVVASGPGPVLFRQRRIGWRGRPPR